MSGWKPTVGYGGLKKAEDDLKSLFTPKRLWLRPETDKEIIFLDDEPFCYYEHNLKLPNEKGELTWRGNYFTCNEGVHADDPGCALCANNYKSYYIGLFTVLDCNEFEYKNKIYKNTRRILAAKFRTLKILEKKMKLLDKTGKKFKGSRFMVSRTDEKSASVGDIFDFMKEEKLDDNGLLVSHDYWWVDKEGREHPPAPFDYAAIAKPVSNAKLASIAKKGKFSGNQEPWDNDPASATYKGSDSTSPDKERVQY